MPLSVSQLIASAETGGAALRLIRATRALTQADIVDRAAGAIGVDQISLIERGKRPMTSKQCTTIAQALHLSDAEEAQLMLLALIDRAPERLRPELRQARLGLTLLAVDAVRTADPQDQLPAFIAAMDAVAEVWPTVKARWETPAAPRAGQGPRPVVEVMTPPAPQTSARTVRQREKPRAE